MSARQLETIIVAYNGASELGQCLASTASSGPVTVVDNSSSEQVRQVVLKHGASYFDPGKNLGFGAGVNFALQRVLTGEPQAILLLNPDASIDPENAQVLLAFLDQAPNARVAAVSPRLIEASGRAQRVDWPFPSPAGAWREAVGLARTRKDRDAFVIGAVLVLRSEALAEVGLFDERFFLYAEEADWQRRSRDLGWRSAVCSSAFGRHEGAGSSDDPTKREALFHAGQETYVRKWFGFWGWQSYRLASCVGALGRALVLRGERRKAAGRRALLYIKGPRRCAALTHG